MSVCSIKNKFLAKFDPYWICRLLGIKAASGAIALCLWNAFFFSPSSPGMYFMTAMIGIIATEALPAYTKKQQLIIFWKLEMIIAATIIIFGFISYFNLMALIGVTTLTYLYFRVLASNTQTAMVPAILVMFGMVGLESGNTDLNAAANSLLFYIEFGLIGSVIILFFPNFRDKTFKSAFLRLLENDLGLLTQADFSNNNQAILSDLSFMKAQLPYLHQAYSNLYENIISYQISLSKQNRLPPESSAQLIMALENLSTAVSEERVLEKGTLKAPIDKGIDDSSMHSTSNLIDGWNQACKA